MVGLYGKSGLMMGFDGWMQVGVRSSCTGTGRH
jgi:hypothetical protein